MWNLFQKNSKISAFLQRKLAEKNGLKISKHAAQLNGVPPISAKTLAFRSLL